MSGWGRRRSDVRAELRGIRSRLAQLEAEPSPPDDDGDGVGDDPARFDWYGETCPCGKPAGECAEHPRARANQRPPAGDWRTWLMLMGRGAGKTRSGAEWVRGLAESRRARRIALVAPTAADARAVMIEGESGLLAISPPWGRPKYEPSRCRLVWPNGAVATAYSADRPERLRGPQHDAAWVDELAAWRFPRAWDNLMFGLRLGVDPRVCVTTTPRPVRLVKALLAQASTAIARGSTHENRAHLAPAFFDKIVATYEGTRLGRQEIYAEVLEVSDGAWFSRFDPARHVSVEAAEYDYRFRVHLAIDCGVSRHVGAVFFQVRELGPDKHRITVFGDYHAEGRFSEANAAAIRAKAEELPRPARRGAARPGVVGAHGRRAGGVRRVRAGLRDADHGAVAAAPRARRARPARDPAGFRLPGDPPAVRPPRGGVPELRPGSSRRRMARRAGLAPEPGRRPDGRPPRRRPRPVPRRTPAGRTVHDGPRGADGLTGHRLSG
jgi:phage terminase large subunit-like protein